ncbi:hypothetical protein CXX84_00105 [Arthrobacter sp. AFG7.2]|nr:hypothetical protein CXX84_00105 [Arthrobacter sp. AFG7.2]
MSPAFCTRGAGRTCGFEGQDPDAERGATQIEYLFIVPDQRQDFDLTRLGAGTCTRLVRTGAGQADQT